MRVQGVDTAEGRQKLIVQLYDTFFATASATLTALSQLQGLRLNVGTAGSGVPSLMAKLFDANRVDPASIKLSQLAQTPATVAFLGDELDAIVFASAPESLMVQMLLQTPGVQLLDFAQHEAYARRFPFLTPVTLPRGVVDLAANVPQRDVRLVATTTSLLARDGTLERLGVELIGASPEAIAKAEDRELFRQAMIRIGLDLPRSHVVQTLDQAREALAEVGLPERQEHHDDRQRSDQEQREHEERREHERDLAHERDVRDRVRIHGPERGRSGPRHPPRARPGRARPRAAGRDPHRPRRGRRADPSRARSRLPAPRRSCPPGPARCR